MTMAFMTTLACSLDVITPLTLYLNTHLIYTKYQVCVQELTHMSVESHFLSLRSGAEGGWVAPTAAHREPI